MTEQAVEQVVLVEVKDGVGWIRLNRPDRMNAVNSDLRKQLLAALKQGERLGLVNRVVPGPELEAEAGRLASRLAAGPAGALAAIKRSVNRAQNVTFEEALDFEFHLQAVQMLNPDFKEGVSAFLEKRR